MREAMFFAHCNEQNNYRLICSDHITSLRHLTLSFLDSMTHLDGFQTTDSFRFDRNRSSSFVSLSSSSGYGSRLSLSPTDQAVSHRRSCLTKYFKDKISKHKSLASLLLSSHVSTNEDQQHTDIYEEVWNLDEQIERLRSQVSEDMDDDCQSLVSMSVDASTTPEQQTQHKHTE